MKKKKLVENDLFYLNDLFYIKNFGLCVFV